MTLMLMYKATVCDVGNTNHAHSAQCDSQIDSHGATNFNAS